MNTFRSLTRTFISKRFALWAAWAALGMAMLTRAEAQTVITITNPSFEAPAQSGPGGFADGATGWTILNGSSGAGVFYPTSPTPPAPNQAGFANSGLGLMQITSSIIGPNISYSFSGYIGRRLGETNPEDSFGALQIGAFVGGIFYPAASLTATVSTPSFSFVSGSFTVSDSGFYGENLAVVFVNQGNAQVLFDDVNLSFTTVIPEPAAYAAWAGVAGLVVAGAMRQRRRRLMPAGA